MFRRNIAVINAVAGLILLLSACALPRPEMATLPGNLFSSNADAVVKPCPSNARTRVPCRTPNTQSFDQLKRIAATSHLAARGDTLTFAVQARGVSYVHVIGGVQVPLVQVGTTDVWAASIHVPDLAEAVLSYRFLTDTTTNAPVRREFRGPRAPEAQARAAQLHGSLRSDTLVGDIYGGAREVISYLPQGWPEAQPYNVVYAADGISVRDLAPLVDTLIAEGRIAPIVLVGVRAARPLPGDEASKLIRTREYVYGFEPDSSTFLAHEKFFVTDVAAWAEHTLHVSSERAGRAIWGGSNGGAFAVAMGLRHPDRFAHVIASSPVYAMMPAVAAGSMLPDFSLTAGTFEETTRDRTVMLAECLRGLQAQTHFAEFVGGHDDLAWSESFVQAVEAIEPK